MNTALVKNSDQNQLKDYIGTRIDNFLADKKARSENTYINYKIDIEQFFYFLFKRHYSFLTVQDLENITSDDLVTYRVALKGEGKVNSTLNRKIASVRKLFGFLEATYPNIRKAIFNVVEKMKENDTSSYGVLTWEEGTNMVKLAKTKKNGDKLSLMIELAIITCYRLNVLLELTLDQIHIDNKGGQDYHVIKVIDKGEKHEKPISPKMFERLTEIATSNNEPLFPFTVHTIGRRFKQLVEEMQLDQRRNIKFHSLKKCGVNFVFDSTGDIMMAQKQGNHKSANTTMKSYLEHKTDYSQMPSYTMDMEIDLQSLEELSKEELLQLITNSTTGTQLELLRKLKDMQPITGSN
jgi:integrase